MPFIFDLDIITPFSTKVTDTTGTTIDLSSYVTKSEFGTVLATKVNTSDISEVATTGSYNDLLDKPVITDEYGIKADYCCKYGIISAPYGLIDYKTLDNEVVIKAGIQLIMPNKETKTQIGSDIRYDIQSITDVTLFLVESEILEAEHVYYQVNEPPEDGQFSYMAWWNPKENTWKFKSNDTGNIWREADGTPIADVHFSNENIVRIDYVGYRHVNSVIYPTVEDLEHTSTELEELAEELGTISNAKLNRDLSDITDTGISKIKNTVAPTSIVDDGNDFIIDELKSNMIYHCGTLSNLIISSLDVNECVPESIVRFSTDDSTMMSLPSGLLKLNDLTIEPNKQYVLRIFDKMVSLHEVLGLTV